MTNMKQTQDDRTIQPFNCSTIQHIKAYAFTLAETLIVIGIIGVVAALTLPNLNHATGDKEKVTKVKKIYASLADAYGRAEAIYGPIDEWFKDINYDENRRDGSERFAKRMMEFLKVSKDCGFNTGCFSEKPLLAAWADINDPYFDNLEEMLTDEHYMVTLSDGISLGFRYKNKNSGGLGDSCVIFVDIDGPNKGKNFYYDDIHVFTIGLSQESSEYFPYKQLVPDQGFLVDFPEYATDYGTWWIVNYDNMDYLKCPDDLDWQAGITSCQ